MGTRLIILCSFLLASILQTASQNTPVREKQCITFYFFASRTQAIPDFKKLRCFTDSAQALAGIQNELFTQFSKGYAGAYVDSIITENANSKRIHIVLGIPYQWAVLRPGNIAPSILQKSGFKQRLFFQEPFRIDKIKKLQQRIFNEYENNGYPFALIQLDSVNFDSTTLHAALTAKTGPYITYDSLVIDGNAKVALPYLRNYLGLKKGKKYSQQSIEAIFQKLKGLPFVVPKGQPQVVFQGQSAHVRLLLDKRNANQFSGILGVMPNNDQTGGLLITGDAKLRLHNALGRGELLDIQWQRLQSATQQLKIQAAYPFLFNIPLGIEGKFDLFRIDTSFLSVQLHAGVQYLLSGTNYIQLFYQYQTSQKIRPADGIPAVTELGNVQTNLYGFAFLHEGYDYRLNPRKGHYVYASAAIGNKNISPAAFDTLSLDTTSFSALMSRIQFQSRYFFPVFKRFTLMAGLQGGALWSPQLYRNELFRLGGLQTIRGFDDDGLYASLYGFGTLEFRFLLDENTFVHVFTEGGFYERNLRNEYWNSWIGSVGTGITFETKIGLFSFTYALGGQRDASINFSRSKIHFGYINYF